MLDSTYNHIKRSLQIKREAKRKRRKIGKERITEYKGN